MKKRLEIRIFLDTDKDFKKIEKILYKTTKFDVKRADLLDEMEVA